MMVLSCCWGRIHCWNIAQLWSLLSGVDQSLNGTGDHHPELHSTREAEKRNGHNTHTDTHTHSTNTSSTLSKNISHLNIRKYFLSHRINLLSHLTSDQFGLKRLKSFVWFGQFSSINLSRFSLSCIYPEVFAVSPEQKLTNTKIDKSFFTLICRDFQGLPLRKHWTKLIKERVFKIKKNILLFEGKCHFRF